MCIPPNLCLDICSFVGFHLALIDQMLQLLLDTQSNLILGVVHDKNSTSVLGSNIVSLPIPSGGIVEHEEELDQFWDEGWIGEGYMQDFEVACSATANFLVLRSSLFARPGLCWIHEADLGLQYAVGISLLEFLHNKLLRAPIAPCCQGYRGRHVVGDVERRCLVSRCHALVMRLCFQLVVVAFIVCCFVRLLD